MCRHVSKADRLPSPLAAIVIAYAAALLALQFHFPRFPSPNERTRLYQLEAIVNDGRLAIDGALERYGDIEDKVVVEGESHANKPPGLTLLALPGYAAAHALAQLAGAELPMAWGLYVARITAVSLPAIWFVLAFARHLHRRGLAPDLAAMIVAGLAFGTGLLPYGAQLMAHATAAAFIGGAALVLLGDSPDPARRLGRAALLAGAAVACEYPAALPATVLLGGYAAVHGRSWRALAHLGSGLLPAAVLVLGYNGVVFGNPLDLGYGHHVSANFAEVHSSGLLGFGLPTMFRLNGLLTSVSRGLFAWSPLLLLALPGLVLRARRSALEAGLLGGGALALILFIAGYPNWHGGWTVGPRYLVAVVPLLGLLVADAVASGHRLRLWAPGLALTGIVLHAIATATWPYLPQLVANPLFDIAWPLLRAGELVPSVTTLLGLTATGGLLIAAGAVVTAAAISARPKPALALLVALALTTLASARDRGLARPCCATVRSVCGRSNANDRLAGSLESVRRSTPNRLCSKRCEETRQPSPDHQEYP